MLTKNYLMDVEQEQGLNLFYDKLDEQMQYHSFEEMIADMFSHERDDDEWYESHNYN